MRLSKSKINTFTVCPRQFKYQYIDEIESETSDAAILGTNVHEIAELFVKQWPIAENDILDTLLRLEENYEDDYKDHTLNLAKFFKKMLIDKNLKIFMAEEYLFSEKYDFNGFADIVFEKDDGKLIVIDYKTGKSSNVKKYKLELCYYKMLIEEMFPDKEVEYAAIYFTKDGDLSCMKFTDSEKGDAFCTKKDYGLAINYIGTVRLQIEEGYFPANKQYLCNYCSYFKLCNGD